MRLWNEHAKLACRLLGLEIKKRKHAYGPDGTLRAYAKSLARADQGRFLVQLALVSHKVPSRSKTIASITGP